MTNVVCTDDEALAPTVFRAHVTLCISTYEINYATVSKRAYPPEKATCAPETMCERSKNDRRPDRDYIARVVLYSLCKHFYERNEIPDLNDFITDVVNQLENQGFNKVVSASVFDDLIDKYTKSDWEFRPKPHLNEQ